MEKDETIQRYAQKYVQLPEQVDSEEYAAGKYFSLPINIRESISRYAGAWQKTLVRMVELSKKVVLRQESVNFGKKPRILENRAYVKNDIISMFWLQSKRAHHIEMPEEVHRNEQLYKIQY